MWPFDTVRVNPRADDLRRRAAIARAVILGTPVEEPPTTDQTQINALGRYLLGRITGGLVPTYRDLPPMPAVDRATLTDEQRSRFNALSRIEQGLSETPHPEHIGAYSSDALRLMFPQKEYQAIRSGDRAVLYNPNDPTDLHPIEETYNLSPGSAHYVGTRAVAERPASVEMDPISRVNAGLKAGTLSKEQADAYIRKLTHVSDVPLMVVPSDDGTAMQVIPKRAGTTFAPAASPLSTADQRKAEAAWQQFDAHLRSNPGLLEKGPGEAVTDFAIATSVTDPEAVKALKLHPRYLELFQDEAPLGAPQGASSSPSAPGVAPGKTDAGDRAVDASSPSVLDQAIDAVTRLGKDPRSVVERAGSMLGRRLSPEEEQRILQAGMNPPELVGGQPPAAALVSPDQGQISSPLVSPVESARGSEAALRAKLATETDPNVRARLAEEIRALRAKSAGGAR